MLYSLRSIALLMLAAGVSLGVFAGSLVANKKPDPRPVLDRQIEERVKLYREYFALDDARTDEVRQELTRHRNELRKLLLRLRSEHKDEFSALVEATERRIRAITEAPPK
ncbi:MAG: hypothetical protein QNJ90_02320 [Planctomycetota bacterium]|nr:hypothetical protein [Planctomycetota bacterium]